MRFTIPAIALLLVVGLGAARAEAQSCSIFVTIKSFDAAAKTVEVKFGKSNPKKYFPRPEGAPTDTSKLPKKCTKRVTRSSSLAVKPTGGRLTVTQVRTNFEGSMLNDTEDGAWLPGQLEKLIADKTEVVAVLRPAKSKGDAPDMTTIYLPITDAERQEIARIEAEAEEVGDE